MVETCLDEDTVLLFVDGGLAEDRIPAVERHVDGCGTCMELVTIAVQDLTPGHRGALEGAPAGGVFGPYRIIDLLGHGGMGIVYRAARPGSAKVVALKTVRLRDRGAMASIRREIHALSRVSHAGVVKILEQGIENGRPWYAMELIEGQTLEAHLAALSVGREQSRRAALGVIRRLSSTLSHLHGWGFVHRDLTPLNVLVRPDGTPVLVDFGLAIESVAGGRDVLGMASLVGGTVFYMAPEQIRGDVVDARADLYALGCILYQAVAGRPPFTGTSIAQVIQKHRDEVPEPPSTFAPGVPPRLEELIVRLLAKDPRARTGFAEDVAAELAGFCDAEPPPSPRPEPYVYRPAFAGREAWMETFDRLLLHLRRGFGHRVYLGGESGIGKTRLVAEVAALARLSGLRVVVGDCAAIGSDRAGSTENAAALSVFRPLLGAVADACRYERPRAERLLGPRGRVLSAYEPALLHLPGQDLLPEPPELTGQAARHRVLRCLRDTLAAFADEAPIVLVLDDLQWADELSLTFLESLPAEFFIDHPVLVIGTYREEEKSAAVNRLLGAKGAESLALDRLVSPTVRAMVADMLAAPDVPEPFFELLDAESDGNPFFVTEYVRAAVGEGWLRREVGGRWVVARAGALPSPGSLWELAGRRLDALSPGARRVLEAASVLGRECDGDLLLAIIDAGDDEALEAIKELLTRCVLEELAGGKLRFVHDKLREVAYAGIAPEPRRELHRRAATAIEQWVGTPLHPVLAHHWARAEVFDRAIEHLEKAGDAALATAAYGDAAAFFERALELAPGPRTTPGEIDRAARWERRLGEAYYSLGDLPRCEAHSREALAGLGRPLPDTRLGWAGALAAQVAIQAAHLILPERAEEPVAERRAALNEAAMTAARIAHSYLFAEDGLALVTTSLLAVNLAEQAGAGARVARPYGQLGYLAGVLNLRGLAAAYFARARRSAERERDRHELAIALYHEATTDLCDGAFARVHELGERALDIFTELRNPQETEIVQTILAHADYGAGRYEASIARCEALLGSARSRANVQHEAWGLYAGARALLRLGRTAEALERLEGARALLGRTEDHASELICAGLSARAHLQRGDLAAAERMADETMALGDRSQVVFSVGDGYDGAAEVYLELWRRAGGGLRGASRPIVARVLRAWTLLARFATAFAIGRPSLLLCSGAIQVIAGAPGVSARLLRGAAAQASAIGMPYEEALARLRLGELDGEGGDAHREAAREMFAALGCAHHLRGDSPS
jgi:tetratricopeptide (TPR) repeat protein